MNENEQAGIHQYPVTSETNKSTRVPLEAHIMSKCPDAQGCLQKLVLPAMEQISDKVDFKLSFIARYLHTIHGNITIESLKDLMNTTDFLLL
jgi:hypothetical protein